MSFIACHIVLRAGTNDFEFESSRDIETTVVSDLMSRKRMGEKGQEYAVEKEGKAGIESWECIVSYLASRSKLLRGGPLPFFIHTSETGEPW